MCFPTLFPTGNFGANYSHTVKLTNAEYIKSRLLNVDSRYRKNPAYVFLLLREKELRELKSGIYNTLRISSQTCMLTMLNNADRELEASLCTALQSVPGTKQFRFKRKGDVDCIREFGSPTFFCTFSCAEYESPHILEYLRKINDVPDSYDNGRLCTEDPISVSRQFSQKFHEFISIFVKKGQGLRQVEHFFGKKSTINVVLHIITSFFG
uniref:Helitron helicase-like domain-containing protein n=1 Tax=Amphimedon queenslandica TaxID=400682 RepID=A0A1X7VBT6_AMPQE